MEDSGTDVEAVVAVEVTGFAVGGFVADDERAAKRANWGGIKVEGAVVVLPGGHSGGRGRFLEKI